MVRLNCDIPRHSKDQTPILPMYNTHFLVFPIFPVFSDFICNFFRFSDVQKKPENLEALAIVDHYKPCGSETDNFTSIIRVTSTEYFSCKGWRSQRIPNGIS